MAPQLRKREYQNLSWRPSLGTLLASPLSRLFHLGLLGRLSYPWGIMLGLPLPVCCGSRGCGQVGLGGAVFFRGRLLFAHKARQIRCRLLGFLHAGFRVGGCFAGGGGAKDAA